MRVRSVAIPLLTLGLGILLGKSKLFQMRAADASAPLNQQLDHVSDRKSEPIPASATKAASAFPGGVSGFLAQANRVHQDKERSYFIRRTVEELPPEELRQWADAIFKLPGITILTDEIMQEVLRRWGSLAPAEGIAWVTQLPPGYKRHTAMTHLFEAVAAVDSQLAIQSVQRLSEFDSKFTIGRIASVMDDPKAAFELLQNQPQGNGYSDDSYQQIFAKWGEQDPASALAAIKSMPSRQHRDGAIQGLFKSWAAQDPAAALAATRQLSNRMEQTSATREALRSAAETNLQTTCDWFKSLPSLDRERIDARELIRIAAAQDPALAADVLSQMSGNHRNEALSTLAGAIAEGGLEKALSWTQTLTNVQDRNLAQAYLGCSALNRSPAEAFAAYSQITTPAAQQDFLNNLVNNSGNAKPDFLLKFINLLPSAVRLQLLDQGEALNRLVTMSPECLHELLPTLNPESRQYQLSSIAIGLAQRDPNQAYEWATQLPESEQANPMRSILYEMSLRDPVEAVQKTMLLTDVAARDAVLSQVLSHLPATEASTLSAILPELTGPIRTTAAYKFVEMQTQANPAAAASFLTEFSKTDPIIGAEITKSSLSSLLRNWSLRDPQAAVTYTLQLADSPQKANALNDGFRQWVGSDPTSASEYLNNLTSGPLKDRATSGLVSAISTADPERALVWAGQIQDESERHSTIRQAYKNWFLSDPTAAETALNAANLPADLKVQCRGIQR